MTIATAVVLTNEGGIDPCRRLAGLPLVLRTVLTLQRVGIRRVVLVTSREDVVRLVRGDVRTQVEVEVAPSYQAALERLTGPAILARHDVVVDPAIYAALSREGGDAPVAAVRDGQPIGPEVVVPGLTEGRVLETVGSSRSFWAERVDTEAGRRRAVNLLFEACRKPVDGIVSRNLNRHVSIAISKWLVDTPIRPNHISVFTLLLGLLAAAFAARGGYLWTLVGAFLMQVDSIVDGVDGELARVRFQQSRLGEWLDNVSDDVTALAFWLGLTLGAAHLADGSWLVSAGWIAVGSHVLFVAMSYRELFRRNSGSYFDIEWFDREQQGLRTRFMELLVLIPRRDFFVFACFVAALFGVLTQCLPVIAIACFATLAAAVARTARQLARGQESVAGDAP